MTMTSFSQGECGAYFRSEKYTVDRDRMYRMLSSRISIIKWRTLNTNYAGSLATVAFLFQTFHTKITNLGYSYEVQYPIVVN